MPLHVTFIDVYRQFIRAVVRPPGLRSGAVNFVLLRNRTLAVVEAVYPMYDQQVEKGKLDIIEWPPIKLLVACAVKSCYSTQNHRHI